MKLFVIVAFLLPITLLNVQAVSSQTSEQSTDSATFVVS